MNHAGLFLRRTLAAALALLVLSQLFPVRAEPAAETEYIVKYRDCIALPMAADDRLSPFDVVSKTELDRLLDQDLLEWYEEDGDAVLLDEGPAVRLSGTLSPYYDDDQWSLDMIGAETAFQGNYLGQGIRVGVIDSGVSPHDDFGSRLLAGRNFIQDAIDPDDTEDNLGHGTRVAGLIAASGSTGYIGAAPGAEIVPLKCTDSSRVKISAICSAIYSAINDFDCKVLNLSLGVRTEYTSLQEAIAYAAERGVVVVSAAGNGGDGTLMYPARYDTVIGVGAVDRDGVVSSRSNHNSSVFVTAPGVRVRTIDNYGGYSTGTGTSFSVPQTAAAAAVMLGIDETLTHCEIMDLLSQTASDRGAAGYDEYYGYGILNLGGCVTALTGRPDDGDPCTLLPEEGPAAALRNDTETELLCTYLLAEYDAGGACRRVQTFPLAVPAGETVPIESPGGEGSFVQLVYRTDDMTPLTAARKR